MKAQFLDARSANKVIRDLIGTHDELHWAVAWGTLEPHGRLLLKHKSKFRFVTFGVAFSRTDPDLVDELVGVSHAYVGTKFPGGTFHPKLYCFRSGNEAAALVGSANFTFGGLQRNLEAAVLLTGKADEQIFKDLFRFVRRSASWGEPVSKKFAAAYRASCARVSRFQKPPRDPVPQDQTGFRQLTTPFVHMSWAEYRRQVRGTAHHDVGKSLELLRTAQRWFASAASFRDLDVRQRKALAGTLGKQQRDGPELELDWGWFGSMRGAGDFANRIEKNDAYLARAVDGIPRHGEVSKRDYDEFVMNFVRAFRNSHRVGRVATASRLLAMKRPDTFLCVCGPNLTRASEAMAFPRTRLDLQNYWDRVVEVIRASNWYNAERPRGKDGELWDFRAAMLDAIYYEP